MTIKNLLKNKLAIGITIILAIFILTIPLRKKAVTYTTENLKVETITDIVSESGNVTSSGRFDVYSPSTGYIEELYVKNGDNVKLKQKLFKVKSTATPQEQANAYTNYQNALSSAKVSEQNKLGSQSQLEIDRQAVIAASTAVTNMQDNIAANKNNPSTSKSYTQNDIDLINSVLTSARSTFAKDEQKYRDADTTIAAGKAAISSTWLAYQTTSDYIVTAIAPGTIANLSSSVGDKVTATGSSTPTLVIQGGLSILAIKIPLNEVDVSKIAVGQTASIIFDAFRNKTYTGHIAAVDTAGTNAGGVITYNASVVIDDADNLIKAEMTATVSVETAKHENVLTVPNSAIKPYQGGKAIIVLDKTDHQVTNKAGKKLDLYYAPVKVGLKGISRTEIIEGATTDTKVVTSSIN